MRLLRDSENTDIPSCIPALGYLWLCLNHKILDETQLCLRFRSLASSLTCSIDIAKDSPNQGAIQVHQYFPSPLSNLPLGVRNYFREPRGRTNFFFGMRLTSHGNMVKMVETSGLLPDSNEIPCAVTDSYGFLSAYRKESWHSSLSMTAIAPWGRVILTGPWPKGNPPQTGICLL